VPETVAQVAFSPQLHASVPSGIFKGPRLSGALHGQWSVAYAAISHVMSPQKAFDSSFNASGCLAQCHSVFYWAQYHSIPRWFLPLQYSPTVVQIMVGATYHGIMQLLAVTGFTWWFFNADLYAQRPQSSVEQSIDVVKGRWEWYSQSTEYSGPASQFPLNFDEVPGVPKCFSFSWMQQSAHKLHFRMFLTALICLALSYHSLLHSLLVLLIT